VAGVRYAIPKRRDPPFWRRCRVRCSTKIPVRCRHVRDHEGDHWFGFWNGMNLDLYAKVLSVPLPWTPWDGEP